MSDDFDRKDYDFSDFDFMEELRKLRGGNGARYICVQSREPTNPKSTAYEAGYQTISEITKERLRRAGKKIKEKYPHVDTGFQVWKLDAKNHSFTTSFYGTEKMLIREEVDGLYCIDFTFLLSEDEKSCEINVVREWIEKISVVDLEKEIPYTNYHSKRLYYNIINTANRKSFEKHFVFFMKRIEKFLTVNASLRGEKAGLESTYQQRLFKNNAYRWLAQCRDIDFKNCEILDGILIDWIPRDLEVFGRRLPYTRTEKQAMGKKLLDEIMDSIFNLKI